MVRIVLMGGRCTYDPHANERQYIHANAKGKERFAGPILKEGNIGCIGPMLKDGKMVHGPHAKGRQDGCMDPILKEGKMGVHRPHAKGWQDGCMGPQVSN